VRVAPARRENVAFYENRGGGRGRPCKAPANQASMIEAQVAVEGLRDPARARADAVARGAGARGRDQPLPLPPHVQADRRRHAARVRARRAREALRGRARRGPADREVRLRRGLRLELARLRERKRGARHDAGRAPARRRGRAHRLGDRRDRARLRAGRGDGARHLRDWSATTRTCWWRRCARFPRAELVEDEGALRDWAKQIVEFIASPDHALDLPLDVRGTAFQAQVWRALQRIPPGKTASYAEIAAALGRPTAVRAVAQACAANTLALLVPCHRVVRGDGEPGGYRWGAERKRALLERERKASGRGDR
jgi:O-6-methylguanine DNA methyltransferase